jgi:hypothetical protein
MLERRFPMLQKVDYQDLPERAKALISDDQKSYIDEFSFYWEDGVYQAFYAGELLATWNGSGWL